MIATNIYNMDDLIDIRDVIKRFEEIEEDRDDDQAVSMDEIAELATLTALLEDCKGYGGDEQWRGDWYPVTLIRDTYFQDYAEQLAEDIGAIDPRQTYGWPLNCIDWEQAARELQMDYTSVEIDGVTYWTR